MSSATSRMSYADSPHGTISFSIDGNVLKLANILDVHLTSGHRITLTGLSPSNFRTYHFFSSQVALVDSVYQFTLTEIPNIPKYQPYRLILDSTGVSNPPLTGVQTLANVGGANEVYRDEVPTGTANLRSINGVSGVSVVTNGDTIDISLSGTVGTIQGIVDVTGDSGGVSLQGGVDGLNVTTRRLVGGTDISVTDIGTAIQVASTVDTTAFVSATNPDEKVGNLTMTAPAKVIQSEPPVDPEDLTNKLYVDTALGNKVTKGGDTDGADLVVGTNDAFNLQLETGGVTKATVETDGTLSVNTANYETLVTADNDVPNKKYVDDLAPDAPPELDSNGIDPRFASAFGSQSGAICPNKYITLDETYNVVEATGQWYSGTFTLRNSAGTFGVNSNSFSSNCSKMVGRYKYPSIPNRYVYIVFTWGGNSPVYAANKTFYRATDPEDSLQKILINTGTLIPDATMEFFGEVVIGTDLASTVFKQPLSNETFIFRGKDMDSGERLEFDTESLLSWNTVQGSGGATIAVSTANPGFVRFSGAGSGSPPVTPSMLGVLTSGTNNLVNFTWLFGGLYFDFNSSTIAWEANKTLLRSVIQNAYRPASEITYSGVTATGITVISNIGPTPVSPASSWTQEDVDNRHILFTLDGSTSISVTATLGYTGGASATYTYRTAVKGGYCRVSADVAGYIADTANNRLPSTSSVESYRYGTTAIPASGKLVLTNAGVLVPASALVVAGITANELRVSSTTLGGASTERFLLGYPAGTRLNFRKYRSSSADGIDGLVVMQTNGIIVDNGSYYSIPIQFAAATFPGVPFDNIVPLTLDLNVPVILEDLQNVLITDPVPREVLMYQAGGQWTNTTPAISDLIDVDDVGRADTNILTWNNTLGRWVVTARTLANQTDVNTTGVVNGQLLVYNSGTQQFKNSGNLTDSVISIVDETDPTKALKFQSSTISTATTRTVEAQDADGRVVLSTTGESVKFDNNSGGDQVFALNGGLGNTVGDRVTYVGGSGYPFFAGQNWSNLSLVTGAISYENFVTPLSFDPTAAYSLMPFAGTLQTGSFQVTTNGAGRLTNGDDITWTFLINFSCAITGGNGVEFEIALFINGTKVSNSYITTITNNGRYSSLTGVWVQRLNGGSVGGTAVANQYCEIYIKRNVGTGNVIVGSAFLGINAVRMESQPTV